jgi:hypothetical protein
VLPVERELEGRVLVGVIMCIRNVIPLLSGNSLEGQGLKGSFGETKQQKTETVSTEQIITVRTSLISCHKNFLISWHKKFLTNFSGNY